MVWPICLKVGRVPFALKPKIDQELDCFLEQEILESVPIRACNMPIVTLVKPNGSVCICADYKCTMNKALQNHAYPVPMMSHILSTLIRKIPETWKFFITMLIRKEGKDKEDIANYHSIALLNVDCKIFAMVIADRFQKILSSIIHSDQKGFFSKRNLKRNLCTTLNVLKYYEKHSDKQLALIFADAERAFDNVPWTFIKTQSSWNSIIVNCGQLT